LTPCTPRGWEGGGFKGRRGRRLAAEATAAAEGEPVMMVVLVSKC
jgi:hypothetical protein